MNGREISGTVLDLFHLGCMPFRMQSHDPHKLIGIENAQRV